MAKHSGCWHWLEFSRHIAPGFVSSFPLSFLGTECDICSLTLPPPNVPSHASSTLVWYSTNPNGLHSQSLTTHHVQVSPPPALSSPWLASFDEAYTCPDTCSYRVHLLVLPEMTYLSMEPLWGNAPSWEATMYYQKRKTVFCKVCQLSLNSQALDTYLLSRTFCHLPPPEKHLNAEGSRLYLKYVLGVAGHGDLLQRFSITSMVGKLHGQ